MAAHFGLEMLALPNAFLVSSGHITNRFWIKEIGFGSHVSH